MKLFSNEKQQTKMAKSAKSGLYLPLIMHLAPVRLSGYQVCSKATAGCAAACLNTAGLGTFEKVQQARINRTKMYFENRDAFIEMMRKELDAAQRRSRKHGKTTTVRLNGTSDIMWERLRFFENNTKTVFEMYPDIIFYDYTKIPVRDARPFENYSLTFSLADGNENDAKIALERGMNVAVVFRNTLPSEYLGVPVIDGDQDDLRFLDPPGVVIGLKAKGKAIHDHTGFVKDVA